MIDPSPAASGPGLILLGGVIIGSRPGRRVKGVRPSLKSSGGMGGVGVAPEGLQG